MCYVLALSKIFSYESICRWFQAKLFQICGGLGFMVSLCFGLIYSFFSLHSNHCMKLLVHKNKEPMIKKKEKKKTEKKAGDEGHEPSPLYHRPLKSPHQDNLLSTSSPALLLSCTRSSYLTSLIMFLGPGVLVSRGRLALLPPLCACVSLPRLNLARLATLSRQCYGLLKFQFAVGENLSTGYGRFLRFLQLL